MIKLCHKKIWKIFTLDFLERETTFTKNKYNHSFFTKVHVLCVFVTFTVS